MVDPENSHISGSGENEEENDRQDRVAIHGTDGSLYNETSLTASFLSHQETSQSSVKENPMKKKKLTARNTVDPENFDISGSGKNEEENDRQIRVAIHGTDRSLYN